MTGANRSNHPDRELPAAKVRELQVRLWKAAKRSSGRRFHALYDRIHRSDVLWEAWRRVKRNRGAAGVDAVTLADVHGYGEDRFIEEIRAVLRRGEYRPPAVRRCYIEKADGKQRPLGIPTVRDRVVQAATKLILEPIFEAGFRDCSYGFRPKRNALGALEKLRIEGSRGGNHVFDADIRDFFGSLDHEILLKRVARRISDQRVLKLVRQWLQAGVVEGGVETAMLSGTPQGGVISPLLSNIYLSYLDDVWQKQCAHLGTLVRYADDFVVMCPTAKGCEEAERRVRIILERLKLELHPDKTRRVDLSRGLGGFDFLGCHLRKRMSGRIWERYGKERYYLHRWPSQKSMKRVRQRIREKTPARRCHADIRAVIADLNPVLRGWGNYFRTGNANVQFQHLDWHIVGRLRNLRRRRKGRNLRPGESHPWTMEYFSRLGLHRLGGTVRYPRTA